MTGTTVHVVARGVYWRNGRCEYLRVLNLDGGSWNVRSEAGSLDGDAQAALDAALAGSHGNRVGVYRSAGGRWSKLGEERPTIPTSGRTAEPTLICELTDSELLEIVGGGMPRAVYARLSRAQAAGVEPTHSWDPRGPINPRLRVSMRGRHGSKRTSAPAVSVTPAPAVKLPAPDPITRPNGEAYFPRLMPHGESDVEMVRRLHDAGRSVLLFGAPGTGKTALLEAAFTDRGFVYVAGTSDTVVDDFVGGFVPEPGGSFRWVDGPMLRAMEKGLPFIVDEIALVDPRVMAVAYSALDGRGEYQVTQNPLRGTVKAAAGFVVHGACNPDAPGADMSEALLSRMTLQVEYGTDYALAGKLGAPAKLLTAARNLDKKRNEAEITWSPQMRELLAYVTVSKLVNGDVALSNLVSSAPVMDRPVVSDVLSRTFGRQIDALRVGEAS